MYHEDHEHGGVCDTWSNHNDGVQLVFNGRIATSASTSLSRRRRRHQRLDSPSVDTPIELPTPSSHHQAAAHSPQIRPAAAARWYDIIFVAEAEDVVAPEVHEREVPYEDNTCDESSLDNIGEKADWQLMDLLARLQPLDLAVDRDRLTATCASILDGADLIGDDTSTITPPTPQLEQRYNFDDTASPPSLLSMIEALYDEADAALLEVGVTKTALGRGLDY